MNTKDKYDKSIKTLKLLFTLFLISVATAIVSYLSSIFYNVLHAIAKDNLACTEPFKCFFDIDSWIYGLIDIVLSLINLVIYALLYVSVILSIVLVVVLMLWLIVVIHYKEKLRIEGKKIE